MSPAVPRVLALLQGGELDGGRYSVALNPDGTPPGVLEFAAGGYVLLGSTEHTAPAEGEFDEHELVGTYLYRAE